MRTSDELAQAMRARGLVTVKEAAAVSMRTQSTIRRWCKAGHVNSQLNGLQTFVVLASLKRWIGGQQEA